MKELSDYSGDFKQDIQFKDFSKESLIDLLNMYCRFYKAIDGFWYLTVMNKVDEKTAIECDIAVWDKQFRYEMKRITQLLNIKGKDLTAFLKCFQFNPWSWNAKYKIEFINNNSALWTVFRCPTIESLEKEGKGRDKVFCKSVETRMFESFVKSFNPDITVKYLKLPPRQTKEDICCQWEFKLNKSTG